MLARANRVTRAEDFRSVVRRGRRTTTAVAVYYSLDRAQTDPARFGFIVSKAVGGAVERNLLRRRLRAISRELVNEGRRGADTVVRALPGAAAVSWDALRDDTRSVLQAKGQPKAVAG